jgi:excisionase family DNA binding protein
VIRESNIAGAAREEKLLITVDEAARRLSIGRSHLYEYIQRGSLPSVQIGRCRRVALRDLDAFIEQLLAGSTDAPPGPVAASPIRSIKRVPKPKRRR